MATSTTGTATICAIADWYVRIISGVVRDEENILACGGACHNGLMAENVEYHLLPLEHPIGRTIADGMYDNRLGTPAVNATMPINLGRPHVVLVIVGKQDGAAPS